MSERIDPSLGDVVNDDIHTFPESNICSSIREKSRCNLAGKASRQRQQHGLEKSFTLCLLPTSAVFGITFFTNTLEHNVYE